MTDGSLQDLAADPETAAALRVAYETAEGGNDCSARASCCPSASAS